MAGRPEANSATAGATSASQPPSTASRPYKNGTLVKFTDGYWRMREGVRASYPAEAYDVAADDTALVVYAPTKKIEHRGDTINTAMLTVTLTAPVRDVVRVEVVHHAGRRTRGPRFALHTDDATPRLHVDDHVATLTSGRLTARVTRGGQFKLAFVDEEGRELTASSHHALAIMRTADGAHHLREQLDLGVDTRVYGLGERFGPLVKNGQTVDMWNSDGGTATEQAYKNVPFLLTNDGYGVFVEHAGPVSFEVASEHNARLQFSVEDQRLTYHVVYGPDPSTILERYTALTGRPALPPPWSFGLWLSTSFTTDYDEKTVTSFVEEMERRDLPLSVLHVDCFWMREFNWCDFAWDRRTFPDPEGMLRRLKARGLRICVWINPYIAQRSRLFDEGREAGYLLQTTGGDVWQCDVWQAGMALVDFTNPDAREWYASKLDALLDVGVDSFKTDFGEEVPTDVAWFDGSDPVLMHNYYTHLYNGTVFERLEKRRGVGEALVFARSATAGGQRFPAHWGGDCEPTFVSMAESLRGGLSLGMSGFGFWSHDIGGFEGTPPPAVFKRWVPFGLLSSHSRLHGSDSYRVPWTIDEESVEVLRRFTHLKLELMPELLRAARQAQERGLPMMRAMFLGFPDDPTCWHLDRQYLLGDNLLVAPVFSAADPVTFYVPSGRWTHLLSGEVIEGPRWVTELHGFDSLPLLVRPGTILACAPNARRPDRDHRDDLQLRAYQIADGAEASTSVAGPNGEPHAHFVMRRDGDRVSVDIEGTSASWQLLLVGVRGITAISGGSAVSDERGVRLRVEPRVSRLSFELTDRGAWPS